MVRLRPPARLSDWLSSARRRLLAHDPGTSAGTRASPEQSRIVSSLGGAVHDDLVDERILSHGSAVPE
jgi:hypothetical protein